MDSSKRNDYSFGLFNAALVLVVVVVGLIPYFCPCITPYANDNVAGIVCQVLTALMCGIASIIGISFSVQDSTFFGVKLKELRELRVGKYYSLQAIMTISVLIIAVNLLFYIFGLVYASYGLSISAVMFCLYIIWQEVPLMSKREGAALKILRERIQTSTDAADIHATEFDKALKYMIVHQNLKTAYQKLSEGASDNRVNIRILKKLLDIQSDVANGLKTIEDKQALDKTINSLSENLIDIVTFQLDISDIFGGNVSDYAHFVTRVLFRLNECPEGKEDCAKVIGRILWHLDHPRSKTKDTVEIDFLFAILLSIVPSSVSRGDLSFLTKIQEYCSINPLFVSNGRNFALLFSLLSLHLYCICELEESVPPEIKDKIKKTVCMTRNQIRGISVVYPWRTLFQRILSCAHVDYHEFMRVFENNAHSMEYMLLGEGMRTVIMNEHLAFQWYVANMLNRYDSDFDDYDAVFGSTLDDDTAFYLKRLYDDCYKDSKTFVTPDYMKKMLSFYGVENQLATFITSEKGSPKFYEYLTDIKAQEIRDEAKKLQEVDEVALAGRVKDGVTKVICSEWGLDKTLQLPTDNRYLCVFLEKSTAVNFDETLIDCFAQSIFYNLSNALNSMLPTQRPTDVSLDERIKALLKEDVVAASFDCVYIAHSIADTELQNRYREMISTIERFQSSILPQAQASFVLQGGFSFNCQVDDVVIERPDEKQINERVEEYKRADGQYVYEGTFLNREDVYDVVSKKAMLITLSIRYALHAPQNRIITIDPFPKQDDENGRGEK